MLEQELRLRLELELGLMPEWALELGWTQELQLLGMSGLELRKRLGLAPRVELALAESQ